MLWHVWRCPFRKTKLVFLYLQFLREFRLFKEKNESDRFLIDWDDRCPCLEDPLPIQSLDRHVLLSSAWAARILIRTQPHEHVDISSCLFFNAIFSAFVPIRFYDPHPPKLSMNGLNVHKTDLMNLPFNNGSVLSLSCLHALEHVGLGRYGEPIDPQADLKAIVELKRVVAQGGHLLLAVPVGKPKVMFNARRVYGYQQVISYFYPFELIQFTLIPDNPAAGDLIENAPKELVHSQTLACGCFWFRKLT